MIKSINPDQKISKETKERTVLQVDKHSSIHNKSGKIPRPHEKKVTKSAAAHSSSKIGNYMF